MPTMMREKQLICKERGDLTPLRSDFLKLLLRFWRILVTFITFPAEKGTLLYSKSNLDTQPVDL